MATVLDSTHHHRYFFLSQTGLEITQKQCMEMIAANDEDGDGELNFSEFVHLLAGGHYVLLELSLGCF